MNKQEMFNKVWAGAKAQGFKRSGIMTDDGDFLCRYRGDCGLKCNAGHLIPDEEYYWPIEGKDALGVLHDLELVDYYDEDLRGLYYSLVKAHDSAQDAADHEARLRQTATKSGLAIPEQ